MLDKADTMIDKKIEGVVKDSWKFARDILCNVAENFIQNKIGVNIVDIAEKINKNGEERKCEERKFDTLFSFKKTLEETRKKMQEISISKTIVLVVDELDRCLPSYATKVLERMHHLFEGISNIIILYAIDSEQLHYSIQEIYGKNRRKRYLKKFISFKFNLEIGEVQDGFEEKYAEYLNKFTFQDDIEKELCYKIIQNILSKSQLDMRNQEKTMERINIIHNLLCTSSVDASIMLYEVISTIAKYMTYNDSVLGKKLYWLSYSNLEKSLGKQLLEYFKELEQKVGSSTVTVPINGTVSILRSCEDGLISRTFLCFKALYCEKQVYYISNKSIYEVNFDICKKFDELGSLVV